MRIKYYDISQSQIPLYPSGSEITIKDLVSAKLKSNPEGFEEEGRRLISGFSGVDLATDPDTDKKLWLRMMNSLIFSISGQMPSPREDNLNLEAVRGIRNYYKESHEFAYVSSPEFTFGCLPYLLSGFGFKELKWSKNGINSHESMIAFVDRLISGDPLEVSSFLCAHKKRREDEPDTLTDRIKRESAVRTLNLLKGTFNNTRVPKAEVYFFQPGSSYEGMISIYPGVIVEALKKSKLHTITSLLDLQMSQMREICEDCSDQTTSFRVEGIDEHMGDVFEEARSRMGDDYRNLKEDELEGDYLGRLSRAQTLPEIRRLMPYYNDSKYIERLIQQSNENFSGMGEDLLNVINFYKMPMTDSSKAFLESIFYYIWGKRSRREGAVSIGLDRDHEPFQTRAFCFGHGLDYPLHHHAPLLYARRNNTNREGGTLHQNSFRQFWR